MKEVQTQCRSVAKFGQLIKSTAQIYSRQNIEIRSLYQKAHHRKIQRLTHKIHSEASGAHEAVSPTVLDLHDFLDNHKILQRSEADKA